MRQPTESSVAVQSQPLQQVQTALHLLEVAGVSPLSRPRVLAAARAIGTSLTLNDWYQGAWELEQSGRYRRRGNGESEWLEPVSSAIVGERGTSLPVHARQIRLAEVHDLFLGESAWLAGSLRGELERIHDGDALFALADTILEVNPIEAERCLQAVSENDPRNIEALTALARIQARRSDLVGAQALVEEVVRLAPENADAHVLLANILDDKGERDAALHHYERAIELNPNSVAAHYNLGVLLVRQGEREAAIVQLRQACELNPDDPSMLLTLAIVDMDRDELVEAGKLLRRALALDTRDPRARRQYGVLLARLHDLSGAEAELRTAIELDPEDGITLMQLCAVLDERGEHTEAERPFRTACAHHPTRAQAYFK